ncbi:hypothetical protein PF004_g22686 [Phytophthora fragariae]|uniref:Chromo domain-containing protein n=1 Tax=Phytophthora fragariae TaxID=53985 RepID=A0A6G0N0B1_9STRA|nr:hypothetical protein PF003_g13330 [Phytophthora fragariae]KAE9187821.1 hypothetical protein PF004_g22686 [Phytophthora fragariae]
MPPPNKRLRHARNFKRKTDGSFWRLKINKNLPARQPTSDEVRTSESSAPAGSVVFARPQAGRGRAETLFDVERLYAKRWVHDQEYYLVQWSLPVPEFEPQLKPAPTPVSAFEAPLLSVSWSESLPVPEFEPQPKPAPLPPPVAAFEAPLLSAYWSESLPVPEFEPQPVPVSAVEAPLLSVS